MQNTYTQKIDTPQKAAVTSVASVFDASSQGEFLQRKADMANNAAQRAEAPRPNNTGMPDNLKSGIESLSGFSMDDVRVHYNSSKPATVQALAYTQGTDIHVAPGQEKCLPHEAWHVAQQMAGRVSPTTNINGMPVNDNAALEHEADVMGEKAVSMKENKFYSSFVNKVVVSGNALQCSHVKSYDIAGRRMNGTIDEANSSYISPHIAFETMAGPDRWIELGCLYNDEIKKYSGNASVFMGVNTCRYKIKKIEGALWVYGEKKEAEVIDELTNGIAQVKGSIPEKNSNHIIDMLPFQWEYVGVGDKFERILVPTNDINVLARGEEPKNGKVIKDGKKVGETVKDKVVVYKYPHVGDYFFPFFEARALIMESAKNSNAGVFRWIDSDVRNDESINKINKFGIDSRMETFKKQSLVISGVYNWRHNDGTTNEVLDFLNLLERKIRFYYWAIKKSEIGKFMASDSLHKRGYIPEPIVYMNTSAHNQAMEKLKEAAENAGENVQQRESDVAFDGMSMIFSEDYSVSKPEKHYFDRIELPSKSDLTQKKLRKGTLFMLGLLKNVRQTVMSYWGIDKALWEQIASQLIGDEEIKDFFGD